VTPQIHSSAGQPVKVLMVCMGNICRSPAAEGLMRHVATQLKVPISVDSAGTHGYHIGSPPDSRSCAVVRAYGFSIDTLAARRLLKEDGERFDVILVMDERNQQDALQILPATAHAKVHLILEQVTDWPVKEVPDPYYGSMADFEFMMECLVRGVNDWVNRLR
jgi:protein-tyrosine phosphatase